MQHTKTEKGYILRLERSEDVFKTLTNFAKEEGITAAEFRAIGAVENLTIGSYDAKA